jgi:hypothetical protein
MERRFRFRLKQSLTERLLSEAARARQLASSLPPGKEREDLLRKARDADVAAHIDDWLRSPGLQPPE